MKVIKLIKEKPLHLYFFPLLFILNHFFSIVVPEENYLDTKVTTLFVNFSGAAITCISLTFLIYFVLTVKFDKIRSSILTCIIVIPFFFFQDLFLSTEELLVGVRLRWLLPLLLIFLVGLSYLVIKVKKPLVAVMESLNVISLSLLIYILIVLTWSYERLKPQSFNYEPLAYGLQCNECPDIYFLILDSYTSNKSLRDYFDFDNEKFTQELRELNFETSDALRSNYNYTRYSIGSILNLNQLSGLDRYDNNFGVNELIKKNSVVKSLAKIGYEIENFSLFEIANKTKYYSLATPNNLGFLNKILQTSILHEGFRYYQKQSFYDLHKDILDRIRILGVTKHEKPKFIYGHIMAPHPPFVIDGNGNRINFSNLERNRENKHAYVEQVKGINEMVHKMVSEILQQSPNSIFIIMGDHGYRFLGNGKESEGFTVFLSYRGPNSKEVPLLRNSSDIFGLVFNSYKKKTDK